MDSDETNEDANEETNNDPAQYYGKLLNQACRYTYQPFKYEKAADAVDDVYEKIYTGEIDLSKVEFPYTYLANRVRLQVFNNHRNLHRNKRKFHIERRTIVDDIFNVWEVEVTKPTGCTTPYTKKGDYEDAEKE